MGNRQSRDIIPTGVFAQLPDQNFLGDYDSNDRLTDGYGYDSSGSTTSHDGWAYTYDAENHLLTAENTGVKIVYIYNGEGIRVCKTLLNKTTSDTTITRYLTDSNNLTGYSQTLEELQDTGAGFEVVSRYAYGLDLISRTDASTGDTLYYGYDGIGSTRVLTDSTGAVAEEYVYDAFGNLLSPSTLTLSPYLFHGEYYDSDLGLYYLRARWMSADIGRFWSMDEFEGNYEDPTTLHKYSAFGNNSVNLIDPSGNFKLMEFTIVTGILGTVFYIGYNATIPEKPNFEIIQSGPIKKESSLFSKPFRLRTKVKNADKNYRVVQWIRGSITTLGGGMRSVTIAKHRDKQMVPFNFQHYVPDSDTTRNSEYPGCRLKRNRKSSYIELFDEPSAFGYYDPISRQQIPFAKGDRIVASVEFIVAVYHKSDVGETVNENDLRNPLDPKPRAMYYWTFMDTYDVQ